MARLLLALLCAAFAAPALDLTILPEYQRPDPQGAIVAPDLAGASAPDSLARLTGARAGYLSCQLLAHVPEKGPYRLAVSVEGAAPKPQVDLYREWFHRTRPDNSYYPDALIPIANPFSGELPAADNRIEGQTAQGFWVDLWIPSETPPGLYRLTARLDAQGQTRTAAVDVEVLAARVPPGDAVTMDHNSYGAGWLAGYFPNLHARVGAERFREHTQFALIHAYHRLFHEHRGIFHQLGYGHGGKVAPEFAPTLAGSGRARRIADWTLYDRHYAPLLDGSAFAGSRLGARPIPFAYLPVNPEWPASFLNWGEPGYEVEFVNVVSALERRFREKGWIQTRFELFFNHKKRYKAFPWDGDETRFDEDLPYFREYARLWQKAVPAGTPVKFVYRNDVSWMMERQFRELAGVINFWVCSGGMFGWYPGAPRLLQDRGDIVWIYGSTPVVSRPLSEATLAPLRAWIFGVSGFVRWLTTNPGPDPWFRFDGGETVLAYPGDRFDVEGPIPSIRLKVQRNAIQDLALLARAGASRDEVSQRFHRLRAADWWTPRPKAADQPTIELTNTDISEADAPIERKFRNLSPRAWQNVRDYTVTLVREARK